MNGFVVGASVPTVASTVTATIAQAESRRPLL